jgi:tetratricopeptide (TPR) repeat protein
MVTRTLKERHVIPRWRSYKGAIAHGELVSENTQKDLEFQPDFVGSKIDEWKQNRTAAHAVDLVGAAILAGRPEVAREAAAFLLAGDTETSRVASELAELILSGQTYREPSPVVVPTTQKELRLHISSLRCRLREHLNNPLMLHDLAHAYGLVGLLEKAKRYSRMALALAPNNRFLLRSAARLFVHCGVPDEGLKVLRRAESLRHDPWLLAAEIAVSDLAGQTSKYIKHSKRWIDAQKFGPFHLSELAGAIATQELESGNIKGTKKLLKGAMLDPTENVVAQTEWLIGHRGLQRIPELSVRRPDTNEANFFEAFTEARWTNAMTEARLWCADQPFSTGAITWGSYVAGTILENHHEAMALLDIGHLANPSDWVIKNNMAFHKASVGFLDDAEAWLDRIALDTNDVAAKGTTTATRGLIAYRRGNIDEGRAKYAEALNVFVEGRDARAALLAKLHWALEEVRSGVDLADEFLRAMEQDLASVRIPEAVVLWNRLQLVAEEKRRERAAPRSFLSQFRFPST